MKARLLSNHQQIYDEDLDVEKIYGLCCMAGNKNAEDLIKVVDINGSVYWCDEIEFMETKEEGEKCTLLDLYKQIEYIGNQFNTWEIPMDKEIKLSLDEDYNVKVEVL